MIVKYMAADQLHYWSRCQSFGKAEKGKTTRHEADQRVRSNRSYQITHMSSLSCFSETSWHLKQEIGNRGIQKHLLGRHTYLKHGGQSTSLTTPPQTCPHDSAFRHAEASKI